MGLYGGLGIYFLDFVRRDQPRRMNGQSDRDNIEVILGLYWG